jgi:DNA-binding response OmpR family regulator
MTWKILTVDDDKGMRTLLRATLERKGFQVVEASDGEAAVEQVFNSPPDLILMDVMMPRMDGFTACQIIRSTKSTAHIPVILLSALSSGQHKARGLEAGANLYLTKPVPPSILVETVNGILRDAYTN